MNFQQHRATLVEHYMVLAMTEGWGQYTRERLKELEALDPRLYGGLRAEVKRAIDSLGPPSSLPPSLLTTESPTPATNTP